MPERRTGVGAWAWHVRSLRALRSQRRHLVFLLLPWVLLIVVGSPLLWWEMERAMRAPILRDRDDTLHEATQIVVRTLHRLHRDVRFLADLPAPLMRTDVGEGSIAADLFGSFSASAADYDQVRWIDQYGQERLRVDNRDGVQKLVPAQALQDKSDRAYFTGSVALADGGVYFSALDLNVEHGQVEWPLQPMLRVASPVREREDSHGIVVINYRAAVLLERLRHLGDRQGLAVYLANGDGEWIEGPSESQNWGGQLGRPETALPQTHPGLWRRMQMSPEGEWRDDSGDWAFSRLSPNMLTAAMDGTQINWDALDLRVLVHVDRATANAFGWRWKALLTCLLLLGVGVAALLVLRLARSMAAESEHVHELQQANQALTVANQRLQRVQAELARAERLSSLGLMVAGVAHEMNTPLGSAALALSTVRHDVQALQASAQQGLRRSELDAVLARCREALGLADTEVRRLVGLVQRFKQVAVDRTTLERRRFDLAEVILDADARLRRWEGQSPVTLELALAPGIEMDSYPGPLQQVVSNLLNNALAHAFQEGESGVISIRTAPDGPEHVTIRVADNGQGIPAELLSRIFEPFFTTRRGKGSTGLGLHIAHQLAGDVLGGTLQVESVDHRVDPHRRGTRFVLRLPRRAAEIQTTPNA